MRFYIGISLDLGWRSKHRLPPHSSIRPCQACLFENIQWSMLKGERNDISHSFVGDGRISALKALGYDKFEPAKIISCIPIT